MKYKICSGETQTHGGRWEGNTTQNNEGEDVSKSQQQQKSEKETSSKNLASLCFRSSKTLTKQNMSCQLMETRTF